MSQSLPAIPDQPVAPDVVKEIAMDIGKEVCAYIDVMYHEAVEATSSTFLLSVRNTIYNEIIGALATTDETEIRKRIEERKVFRRRWKAQYKKLRETDYEAMRNATDVTQGA